MVLDRARAGGGAGAARFDPRPRHGRKRANRAGLWRAGDRHRHWDSVLEPSCAVDMGTCGGRCARYRHARNRTAAGQSEKRECRTCSCRRCRRYGAGCRLRNFTRWHVDSSPPRRRRSAIDYHRRTGFPKPPEQMRGAARDFEVPRDMRTPEALRPFPTIPIPSD